MAWTKELYSEYEANVATAISGLVAVSPGPCPGCDDCGLVDHPDMDCPEYEAAHDPHVSSQPCDCCGDSLQGERYPAHGIIPAREQLAPDAVDVIVHLNVCADCYYYLEYARLDDKAMSEIEAS